MTADLQCQCSGGLCLCEQCMLHAVHMITSSYKQDSPAHSSAAGSGEEDAGRLECEQRCAYL